MNTRQQRQFIEKSTTLLEAGVSLRETLAIMVSHEKGPFLETLMSIQRDIERGMSLYSSVSKYKINTTTLSLIACGESSGMLSVALRQATQIEEKRAEIKNKLISALIYPLLIGVATLCMTLFLILYIFPKIIPLFYGLGMNLPLLTRMVQAIYKLGTSYGLYIFISIIFITFIFVILYRKKFLIRQITQSCILRVPGIRILLTKYILSNQMRSISMLLESGQSLPHIIHELATGETWIPYTEALHTLHNDIIRGEAISHSLQKHGQLYPQLTRDLIQIGERTGSLAQMFHNISILFDKELDVTVRRMSALVEPILMIVMGIVVGSVALSIILPIYEITNNLQH